MSPENPARTIHLNLTPLDADTHYEILAGQHARAEAMARTKIQDPGHDPDEVRALKREAARYYHLLEELGGAIAQARLEAEDARELDALKARDAEARSHHEQEATA